MTKNGEKIPAEAGLEGSAEMNTPDANKNTNYWVHSMTDAEFAEYRKRVARSLPKAEEMPSKDAAFVVWAADGKKYEIFADGRISGFGEGAIIFNRIPTLLRHQDVKSRLSACPASGVTSALDGGEQGAAESLEHVTACASEGDAATCGCRTATSASSL